MTKRPATADVDRRSGVWRSLDLVGPTGRFLRRRGVDLRLFGVYLHWLDQPDPGLDLHDHPWPFATFVVWGGYTEEAADARDAPMFAALAEHHGGCTRGVVREWRRWSLHRIRMTEAHRITTVRPRTVTLVFRGRKSRQWGFYLPRVGYVDQRSYDYEARRPVHEVRPTA